MSTVKLDTISNRAGTASVPTNTVINGSTKAWVNFNGTTAGMSAGSQTGIRAQFNVSGITDNGVGDYTIHFLNAMPDANYTYTGMVHSNTVNGDFRVVSQQHTTTPTTSALRVNTKDRADNFTDPTTVCVAIFR